MSESHTHILYTLAIYMCCTCTARKYCRLQQTRFGHRLTTLVPRASKTISIIALFNLGCIHCCSVCVQLQQPHTFTEVVLQPNRGVFFSNDHGKAVQQMGQYFLAVLYI